MSKKSRDEFSQRTIIQIAKRAGWLCSFPSCRAATVGATEDGKGEINIGIAAHICAAAPGGPRYDEKMSAEVRASVDNGIWMCSNHGKAIDADVKDFTTSVLREWKRQAEQDSWRRVLRNELANAPVFRIEADLTARLRTAASQDLDVFRKTAKWPATSVALRLEVDGFDAPVTTDALARAVTSLDDLILVAGPGMGKTTTVFQVAEGVLAADGVPVVVLLNDWAIESVSVLDSILKRPAFREISEDDFRSAAARPGFVLLLDGWNELDAEARKRVRIQVNTLKAELPEFGLVVTARKPRNQALDIPFSGKRIDLLPLSDEQQLQTAAAMRGSEGIALIDQASRTAGVRELVAMPLYLVALLSLPSGAPFPTTREEVLRHFVAAHEREASRAEALYAVVGAFQQDYLDGLAAFATRAASTAIADGDARWSVSETVSRLTDKGQIAGRPEPEDVLNVLVANHVLMRAGDAPGISFQHEQFQEWYASHLVEHRILAEVDDLKSRETLKAEIFNWPAWEGAILFAVERMSRRDAHSRAACGKAILIAFEVDPLLAAEMIFRSTAEVWTLIAKPVQTLAARWHVAEKSDRALRFMLTSGRPEFLEAVWPLITHENNQISLEALRNCKRFRPSILGSFAAQRIRALSGKCRSVLLHEIAAQSGMEGLDLVADIAKDDPEPQVKASVVDALAFRRADRHIAIVLRNADEKTFDLVCRKGITDQIDDENVQKGIESARQRMVADGVSENDRLRLVVYAQNPEDRNAELSEIIGTMEIDKKQDAGVPYIYEASKRYPHAVAEGLLKRLREGRALFHGADDILAATGFALEDEEFLALALASPVTFDDHADAAASILGPGCVGKMIDALLELAPHVRTDRAASETFSGLQRRIAHVPGASLVTAISERSSRLDDEQTARMAELLSRRPDDESNRGRPFDALALAAIQNLVQEWGERMLASEDAQRWHKAAIGTLASHAPAVHLLPLLKKLLDDNLRRLRAFRAQAQASGWRRSDVVSEAREPMTHEYQRAFLAIKAPETAALVREYLEDEDFGALAAHVLADQWRATNEPARDKRFLGGIDWSDVKDKRAARAADPNGTCMEAEAIFAAIDRLTAEGATAKQQRLAVSLGIIALRLPHGRRDAMTRKLMSLAPRDAHQASRSELLLSFVLSGEEIDIADVVAGIAETFEAGKTQSWILTQSDGHFLKVWLRLLPFVSRPAEALSVITDLPPEQRDPRFLRDLLRSFAYAPTEETGEVLLKLAEADPRFYDEHEWWDSVTTLGTVSSARRLIDLVARDDLNAKTSVDGWRLVNRLGGLLSEHPELRGHVYGLLKHGPTSAGLAMLAGAVARSPDEKGLLVLVRCEQEKRSFLAWQTIESVVTERVPLEGYRDAYNVVPVAATELRRKLFAMTTDGGTADVAARWLDQIDEIRDDYGLPNDEPRHPDLASGKPWPIIAPDADATPV